MVHPGCSQTALKPEHPLCQGDSFLLSLESGTGWAEVALWHIPSRVAPFPALPMGVQLQGTAEYL